MRNMQERKARSMREMGVCKDEDAQVFPESLIDCSQISFWCETMNASKSLRTRRRSAHEVWHHSYSPNQMNEPEHAKGS